MAIEEDDVLQKSEALSVAVALEVGERDRVLLDNLYVLIHPLGMAQGAQGERKQMVVNIKEKLNPGQNDFVWFMPMQIMEKIGESKRILRRAEKDPTFGDETLNWPSLYKTLRGKLGREKIMLVPEIVFDRFEGDRDLLEDRVQGMVQMTQDHGYEINEDTLVTFGGEAIDQCLKKGAIKLLQHLPVNKIEIDLNMSAPSASMSREKAIEDVVEPVNRGVWGTNLHAEYVSQTDRILITKEK